MSYMLTWVKWSSGNAHKSYTCIEIASLVTNTSKNMHLIIFLVSFVGCIKLGSSTNNEFSKHAQLGKIYAFIHWHDELRNNLSHRHSWNLIRNHRCTTILYFLHLLWRLGVWEPLYIYMFFWEVTLAQVGGVDVQTQSPHRHKFRFLFILEDQAFFILMQFSLRSRLDY